MKKYIALLLVFVMILSCSVVASAEESSFITYTDGKSYEGLPEFPTYTTYNKTNGGLAYSLYNVYILYWNDVESLYYLVCTNAVEDTIYLNDNNKLCSTVKVSAYNDVACTDLFNSSNLPIFDIYRCGQGATVWTFKSSHSSGAVSVALTDELIQSSDDIYTDKTLTSVFIQPAGGRLVSGMSSSTIVKMMTAEMVGLLPSAIGLVILVTAFWMGWRLLRRELLAQ